MKKLIIILLCLIFMSSCGGKRVIWVTEIKDIKDSKSALNRAIAELNPDLDANIDMVYKGAAKWCHSIKMHSPFFFCVRDTKAVIISFYKATDKNENNDLSKFKQLPKSKKELLSYNKHIQAVKLFSDYASGINEVLLDSGQAAEAFKSFLKN